MTKIMAAQSKAEIRIAGHRRKYRLPSEGLSGVRAIGGVSVLASVASASSFGEGLCGRKNNILYSRVLAGD
jgi:hypothetical protein